MLTSMDRYIARIVLQSQGVVLLCLVVLMTLFAFIDELQDVAIGYEANHALAYIALTTPRRTYEVMPYVAFVGTLIGLGVLANSSELTVLRSAGVSLQRLFLAVAVPATVLLVLNLAMGETIAPDFEARATALKLDAQQQAADRPRNSSNWFREGNLYTNVDGFGGEGVLLGVRQFELDENGRLERTVRAARAVFQGDHWRLEDVEATYFMADSTEARRLETLRWESLVEPEFLSAKSLIDPQKLGILDLRQTIDYLEREALETTRYEVALWGRLLQPVAILGLVWLATGFVVGPLREVSMGVRLSMGLAVGLGFKYLQDLFAPMATVFGVSSFVAVIVPILICWAAGFVLVRRAA